jgi:ribosomal protein S18 acetylase RimI-like enzyme
MKIYIDPYFVYQESVNTAVKNSQEVLHHKIKIRLLEKKDLKKILTFPDRLDSLDRLQKRFERGDICVSAWHDKKLIAFSWANVTTFEFLSTKFDLFENEAYLYDAYTSDKYRGRRLAYILRNELYKILNEKGINKLYSVSLKYNTAAIKFKKNIKAEVIGFGYQVDLFHRWKFSNKSELEKSHLQ